MRAAPAKVVERLGQRHVRNERGRLAEEEHLVMVIAQRRAVAASLRDRLRVVSGP